MLSNKIKNNIKLKENNVKLFDDLRYNDYSRIFSSHHGLAQVKDLQNNGSVEQIRMNTLYRDLISIYKQLGSAVYLRSEYNGKELLTNGCAVSDKLMGVVLKYFKCKSEDVIFFIEDKQFSDGVFFVVFKNSLSKDCINNYTITITCPMFAISASGKYYYKMKKFNYVRVNEDYFKVNCVEDI